MSAWAQGGNVPSATVRLVTTPSSLSAKYSFGCGSQDGTASCNLGEVDANSSRRQLQAQAAIPATATSVTSVKLTVIGSAANLSKDPQASSAISVTAATTAPSTSPTPSTTPPSTSSGLSPSVSASPLSVDNLPFVNGMNGTTGVNDINNGMNSTLSPGGNAGGLFPTLNPSPTPAGGTGGQGNSANAKTVANTSALPLGAPVVGAQLVGLGVLALAFVLAVTRMSIRRRPAASAAGAAAAGSAAAAGGAKPNDADKPEGTATPAAPGGTDEAKPED